MGYYGAVILFFCVVYFYFSAASGMGIEEKEGPRSPYFFYLQLK